MKVLITGSNGFIGKNLKLYLDQRKDIAPMFFTRENTRMELSEYVQKADVIIHLAGVNRAADDSAFEDGNVKLTKVLCDEIKAHQKTVPIIYTSSIQASENNAYGVSKRKAEGYIFDVQKDLGAPVFVFRLPNIYGKWCKPKYNSAVATFCYNIARDMPITVRDPKAEFTLVYVEDLVHRLIEIVDGGRVCPNKAGFETVEPAVTTTVGQVADTIKNFHKTRKEGAVGSVGTGFIRKLYSTYISYLPSNQFKYSLIEHADDRGMFVEMVKTPESGQVSFFSAFKNVTRGEHFHHTKTEKFLVVKGNARFRFRNLENNDLVEVFTSSKKSEIVETIPGWAHDVTNVGSGEMLVIVWANEVFDRENPDTYPAKVWLS